MKLTDIFVDGVKTRLYDGEFNPQKVKVVQVTESGEPLQFLHLNSSNLIGWNSSCFIHFERSDWLSTKWFADIEDNFQDLKLEFIPEFIELKLLLKEEWLQELDNSPRDLLSRLHGNTIEYGQVMRVEEISLDDKLKQKTWVFSWPLNSYATHWMNIYTLWRFKQGLLSDGSISGGNLRFYTEAEIQRMIWEQIKDIYQWGFLEETS